MNRRSFMGIMGGFFSAFFFGLKPKIKTPVKKKPKEDITQYKRINVPLCRRIYPGLMETHDEIDRELTLPS